MLVEYTDGTSVKMHREDNRIVITSMNQVMGVYEAPDGEKAASVLKRVGKSEGEVVKRIFDNLFWLPGTTIRESLSHVLAAAEQTGNTVSFDMSDYSIEAIHRLVDLLEEDDSFRIVSTPTMDEPTLRIRENQ